MTFDKLYLEVTRNCTFKCEHCIKGNRQAVNMDITTLKNTLKDIDHINTLLLTGGEPLLNVLLIEELSRLIKDNNIGIDTIGIVTNGSVCTERHIEALKELKANCSDFAFFLSCDLFHRLEWDRLDIHDLIEKNYCTLHRELGLKKFLENDRFNNVSIYKKGRAALIGEDRLKSLGKKNYINFKLVDVEDSNKVLSYDQDGIHGKVCIDVNGNLVEFCKTYAEEDLENEGYNVNYFPLNKIIYDYIDYKNRVDSKTKRYYS